MRNVDRLITTNSRRRKSAGGTSGSLRLTIRMGNATAATIPTASATYAVGSLHSFSWPRMSPNEMPPTATAMTIDPSQSRCARRVLVARLGHMADRGIQRQDHQGHVQQERQAPGEDLDHEPADQWAEDGQCRRRGSPDAEGSGPPLALEARRDDRQRSRHQQGAGGTLAESGTRPRTPWWAPGRRASRGAEEREADGEDLLSAVLVGQRARDDEECGEDRQIAAGDVGLALEDADDRWPAAPRPSWAARR